jgi:hypothetical protein
VASAVESALSQDHPNVEVIVIDDGSTDGSLKALQVFTNRPNFRCETGPNRGGNVARNRALQLAEGEFIQFLDADDVLHPTKLRKSLAAMSPNVDAVLCDYIECSTAGSRTIAFPPIGDDLVEYFTTNVVQTSIPLHRAGAVRTSGGFDETLPCCQEYEFHLRLARKIWKRVAQVHEELCTVVKLAGSISTNEARVYSRKATILEIALRELEAQAGASPQQRAAIATELYVCGRHMVRHGLNDQAAAAFELAKLISPTTGFPARAPMRALAWLLGPVRAEQLRLRIQSERPTR